MAAKTLSDHGINDFLILEATDKIGGRMVNTDFSGYTVEIGANWVEGVGGKHVNPIWELAKRYNLRTSKSNFDNLSSNVYNEDILKMSIQDPV
ncbi:hypothetical protein KP509_30G040500 [Ceratopteris richardii]|uniref:Amine oxidase domain-containing protein n=1 Tax=Ceratopteris richardii TaxID=49495 RepID=A0A8T2R1M7_CERRI|nr:hypothetical protein KP509_30G040500 [Ceratopteris richardii]